MKLLYTGAQSECWDHVLLYSKSTTLPTTIALKTVLHVR